ncbi:DUF4236 domain-containing protein [Clostridium magnum]|uniref:DUF4236 domain-containing protein n=1 Tax=Clostridium magnum DSM 2767 TaxID=1121326 RepID=A0A162QM26_9CLOT|nr:DUF4236 domain-containing protein [Clostridium magnum]KZL88699.1 hypothetical protein CLMAG_59880 [Clostridium magnum DSM 2767]SHJ63964.1 Protein of unknown function [Clostridium magnum DSM 2767]
MGFSFRKSIKIGKNTRINFSKTGGIGISTGVKGARVSMNKKGVRTTLGVGGLQYRKDYNFKSTARKKEIPKDIVMYTLPEGVYIPKVPAKITNWTIGSIVLVIAGFVFIPVLLLAVPSLLFTLGIMATNKEFKSSYLTQRAIQLYKTGNFELSKKYCIKAIKKFENNNSAKTLLKHLEASH